MARTMPELRDYLDFITARYLGVRPRSEKEMRIYLARKLTRYHLPDEEVTALIDMHVHRLLSSSLLDDEAFARWYVDEKSHFKQRGPLRLRIELQTKGINPDIIDQALFTKEEKDADIIKQLLSKKYRSYNLNIPEDLRKVRMGLLRRGFSLSDIKTAIEELD